MMSEDWFVIVVVVIGMIIISIIARKMICAVNVLSFESWSAGLVVSDL